MRRLALAAVACLAAGICAFADEIAGKSDITLLSASPGEDSSHEMRVSWHSSSDACKLAFVEVDENARAKTGVSAVECEKVRNPVEYSGRGDYWLYRAELKNLKPGAKYAYRVTCGDGKSAVQTFRTAKTGGAFNFMWIGDIHSTPSKPGKMEQAERLVRLAETAAAPTGGIDFILCTGDFVKHGQTYSCWTQWDRSAAFLNYMFAAVSGNKEYYRDSGKTRWHDKWFANGRNNPPNGARGLAATYWFNYGGVLFVGLDTLAHEGKEMPESVRADAHRLQAEWLERTVASQKGRFRYLLVFQHYPYFRHDGPCSYGGYEKWRDIFDRLGVDFALSGDSHSYVRSRRLKGGKEDAAGTVYAVCPEIDAYNEYPALKEGEGLVAMRDEHSSSYGACWFSVDDRAMTLHYINRETGEHDSFAVENRRRK